MLACPECGLLHRNGSPPRGAVQACVRCGAVLGRGPAASLETALALNLAALILFLLADAFPLLALRLHGSTRIASIPGCVRILGELGWPWLAALLLTTMILGPLIQYGGMVLVLLQLTRGRPRPWTARLFRVLEEFRSWGMAEVFMLGVLVSYSRLARMATIEPGASFYALGGFILMAALAASHLEPRTVWNALPLDPGERSAEGASLRTCSACGLVTSAGELHPCPRCRATLHQRKPGSLSRTWALLWTGMILYIPANVLPVTRILSLGRPQEDTILSGVLHFLRTGSWPLALLIFVVSILVPLLKFAILALLLLAVRFRWSRGPRLAGLYRLTETVGRWSMVDIFAISLTVAMLQMGGLTSVVPRPGAMAFTLMVVITILAVRSFDPRLIWDALEPVHG